MLSGWMFQRQVRSWRSLRAIIPHFPPLGKPFRQMHPPPAVGQKLDSGRPVVYIPPVLPLHPMRKIYLTVLLVLNYALPLLAGDVLGVAWTFFVQTVFFGGWVMSAALLLQFLVKGTQPSADSPQKLTKAGIFVRALAWPSIVFPLCWVLYRFGEVGVMDFRVNSTDFGFLAYSFAVHVLYAILVPLFCFIGSVANENR